MDWRQLLNKLKVSLRREYPAADIILFGSRARGDYSAGSDWDILILIDANLTDAQKIELQNQIFQVELETGEMINSIIHTRQEWNNPLMQATPFYQNVIQEGVIA